MTTLQNPQTDNQLSQLLLQLRASQSADMLSKIKETTWNAFVESGLPEIRNEAFRYMTLRKLYAKKFVKAERAAIEKSAISSHILEECRNSHLVFVNGYFEPSLSDYSALPKNVVIDTLNNAMKTYGSFINNRSQSQLKNEKDPFALINAALQDEGLFLYVPPKTVVESPLQLIHVVVADDQTMLMLPRWQAFVGAQSELSLVQTHTVLSGNSYAMFHAEDIVIEENAHVRFMQMNGLGKEDVWHFESARASLKRNSSLDAVAIAYGGEGSRLDWHAVLNGENAEVNLSGLAFLNELHECHAHILMEHVAPNCRSFQTFKNILYGSARSSFEGKIYIHKEAQQTDAFQLNNNLLLSDSAQAYSRPNLEIFADDVKASHGSTTGQLNAEQLFYLLARGFDIVNAQNLLIQGFCSSIWDKLTIPSVRQGTIDAAARFIAAR